MPDHELDVQTCLTAAIPRCAELFGKWINKFIEYQTKTPPNSEQPTDLPRGVGIDVIGILAARKVLALEAKKVDHKTQKLGKVESAQVEFLKRLEQHALFECYLVFDKVPDLRFDDLPSWEARRTAQLNAIAAVHPASAGSATKNIADLIGAKASGLTMLDVITRIVFETPDTDPSVFGLCEVLAKNLTAMNNCVLWFFGDGYVLDLTLDQVKKAMDELVKIDSTNHGRALVAAHETLRRLRRDKAKVGAGAIQKAKDDYGTAVQGYLTAVRHNATAAPDADDMEMEAGGTVKRPGGP